MCKTNQKVKFKYYFSFLFRSTSYVASEQGDLSTEHESRGETIFREYLTHQGTVVKPYSWQTQNQICAVCPTTYGQMKKQESFTQNFTRPLDSQPSSLLRAAELLRHSSPKRPFYELYRPRQPPRIYALWGGWLSGFTDTCPRKHRTHHRLLKLPSL